MQDKQCGEDLVMILLNPQPYLPSAWRHAVCVTWCAWCKSRDLYCGNMAAVSRDMRPAWWLEERDSMLLWLEVAGGHGKLPNYWDCYGLYTVTRWESVPFLYNNQPFLANQTSLALPLQ